ncbi:MAG: hypothetical protein ACFE8U_08795 [Candidatus Hermodarchaeota archaeon]
MLRGNLLILVCLCFFSLFLQGEAAFSSLLEEELIYQVQPGDQKTFTFPKFFYNGGQPNVTLYEEDGTPFQVSFKKGTKITFHILEVKNRTVYYQITIDGVKTKKMQLGTTSYPYIAIEVFLKETTLNKTYWETWCEGSEYYELKGDLLIYHRYRKYENSNLEVEITEKVNWKTGWLSYRYTKYSKAGNVSIEVEITTESRLISGFEVISSIGGLAILVCLVIRPRKRK